DAPGSDLLQCLLARDRQQLDHDVENGSGGQGQEADGYRVIDDTLADQGSRESGTAADESEHEQVTPGGASAGRCHRRDDSESFSCVVQSETDDQQDGELQLTLGR